MKKIVICLILVLLFIVGCKGMGQAIAQTRNKCCCRVVDPYGHQFVHFSVCSPPDYKIATDLGANQEVDTNSTKCEKFCIEVIA